MDLNQIKMLKSDLDCSYEIGIWSEIDSFLECREEYILEKSQLFTKRRTIFNYRKIKRQYRAKERIFFKELVDFLEYGRATSYLKSILKNKLDIICFQKQMIKKDFS